jgi:seryl-tRNA synthetase
MYDFRILRDEIEDLQQQLGVRASGIAWDSIRKLSEERRVLIGQVEDLRHQLKKGSEEVANLKGNKQPADEAITSLRSLGDQISDLETQLRTTEDQLENQALRIPNIPHPSVPQGSDAKDNVEIRRWGELPTFSFKPRSHDELGEAWGILDFERAAKIAGSRFSVSTGPGARLERALANFMLDLHTQDHGYTEVLPPFMVNRTSMTGTGQIPNLENDLFHLKDDDYLLIPTAEVPLTNLHREEILKEAELPLRYTSHTPCFRREAGSYGQDTRGLIRVHQFNKVELVTFSTPEKSSDELERLTGAAETVLQRLRLPYRVMALCTGDLGFAAAKTFDLEVWLPSQETYREVSSCSNFEAFQARRANIRYRPQNGKPGYVHTLNGSALAIGRTLVAILENYQRADGSVEIPDILRPYMGGHEIIEP